MNDDPTPDDVSIETPLPDMELPDYHGRPAKGMKTSIAGTGNRIQTPHEIGSTVVLLIEAKVKGSGHEETNDGILYVEKMNTVDLFEIPGAQGKRLVSVVRSAYRTAKDGEIPLPEPGAEYPTDGSGVVVTPGDAMGVDDPIVASLTDESKDPVVIVYSDGVRELWPDEFDPGDPRPVIGAAYVEEGTDKRTHVAKILHAETGETLAEWTEEDENARLLRKENELQRAEALERFEELRARNEAEELEGSDAEEFAELRDRFTQEAREDREVHEDLTRRAEQATDPADPTPDVQVDPEGADGQGDGPDEETFPGFEGDPPDEELEIEDVEGAVVIDLILPTTEDFAFVDRKIEEIRPDLEGLTDRDRVLRLLKAEEQGRGRDLKPRKGVLDLLTKRAAEIFSDLDEVGAPDPDGDGMDVPEDLAPEED